MAVCVPVTKARPIRNKAESTLKQLSDTYRSCECHDVQTPTISFLNSKWGKKKKKESGDVDVLHCMQGKSPAALQEVL